MRTLCGGHDDNLWNELKTIWHQASISLLLFLFNLIATEIGGRLGFELKKKKENDM